MDPSYRIVPAQKVKSASVNQTANSFGLHDTMHYGPRSISAEVQTSSSLKGRLEDWSETQDNLKLTMMRNTFGLHAPLRMMMERKLVSYNPHMPVLPQSNVHLDVLMGRDETIDFCDVLTDTEQQPPLDIHRDMEKKLKL